LDELIGDPQVLSLKQRERDTQRKRKNQGGNDLKKRKKLAENERHTETG